MKHQNNNSSLPPQSYHAYIFRGSYRPFPPSLLPVPCCFVLYAKFNRPPSNGKATSPKVTRKLKVDSVQLCSKNLLESLFAPWLHPNWSQSPSPPTFLLPNYPSIPTSNTSRHYMWVDQLNRSGKQNNRTNKQKKERKKTQHKNIPDIKHPRYLENYKEIKPKNFRYRSMRRPRKCFQQNTEVIFPKLKKEII